MCNCCKSLQIKEETTRRRSFFFFPPYHSSIILPLAITESPHPSHRQLFVNLLHFLKRTLYFILKSSCWLCTAESIHAVLRQVVKVNFSHLRKCLVQLTCFEILRIKWQFINSAFKGGSWRCKQCYFVSKKGSRSFCISMSTSWNYIILFAFCKRLQREMSLTLLQNTAVLLRWKKIIIKTFTLCFFSPLIISSDEGQGSEQPGQRP